MQKKIKTVYYLLITVTKYTHTVDCISHCITVRREGENNA